MSYTKALHSIRRAEDELGFQLLQCRIGGVGGGGSKLSRGAEALVNSYEAFAADLETEVARLYLMHLSGWVEGNANDSLTHEWVE